MNHLKSMCCVPQMWAKAQQVNCESCHSHPSGFIAVCAVSARRFYISGRTKHEAFENDVLRTPDVGQGIGNQGTCWLLHRGNWDPLGMI